jgi:ATP-binding cassette subfamily B (MDR/TAP) protein 1
VPYSKLYSLADSNDMAYAYIGWFAAGTCGIFLPSFIFFLGDIIDAFDPSKNTPDEAVEIIEGILYIFFILGICVLIFGYLFYSMLLIFSERVTAKIKVRYLHAIITQDCSWFDLTSPGELPARIGSECLSIQKALGEKMGTVIFSCGIIVCGFVFAFVKGFLYSMTVIAFTPILAGSASIVTSQL